MRQETSEEELIRRSRKGDTEAFGEIVLRYQDRIIATVYRILSNADDARDLAQEAFLRAYSKLHTFEEGARFSTWLYTIALNLTRSELRKRKVRKTRQVLSFDALAGEDGKSPEPPDTDAVPPEEILGRRELHRIALREIDALEPEAREVLVLRDMQELSYEEIANVVGCPVGTVRSRLHRARAALRERLSPLVSDRPRGGAA